MSLFKKMLCYGLATVMLVGVTGCFGKGDRSKADSDKAKNNNMAYVAWRLNPDDTDKREFYFIDGNAKVKKYSGYNSMKDFVNGLSVVSKDGLDLLIDKNNKEIAKYNTITRKEEEAIFYEVTKNSKVGLLDCNGKVLLECKYAYIHFDDDYSDEDVIEATKEDKSVEIFSLEGEKLLDLEPGVTKYTQDFDDILKNDKFESDRGSIKKAFVYDGKQYFIVDTDDNKQIIVDKNDKKVFEAEAGAKICIEDDRCVFYTKKSDKLKIYSLDNFKQINKNIYTDESNGILFWGEKDIVINEYGDVCEVKGVDKISANGVKELLYGYVSVRLSDGKYMIIDAAGDGSVVTVDVKSATFSDLVPYYKGSGDDTYYDYNGKVIIDTKNMVNMR